MQNALGINILDRVCLDDKADEAEKHEKTTNNGNGQVHLGTAAFTTVFTSFSVMLFISVPPKIS